MKCSNCGSSLQIEDSKCPYCGSMNPYFEKHREEMFHFKKDYEKTKEEVIKKSGKVAGMSVKITVIAILVALDILMLFLAGNSWSIMHEIEKGKAERNADIHRMRLEAYEVAFNYDGLAKYYEEYSLYGSDSLEDFDAVYRACSNYAYIYQYIVELGNPDSYMTDEERIEYICENLDYVYDTMEPKEYDLPQWYQGKHGEVLKQMKYDLKVLIMTYANVSQEEADAFPDMSDGRRQVAMERGLGLYED